MMMTKPTTSLEPAPLVAFVSAIAGSIHFRRGPALGR
jgi:hypothetical protein